jgi:hypothetical protein
MATYDPRPLPELISFVDTDTGVSVDLIGPFCRHCGANRVLHKGRDARCPETIPFGYPAPVCGCHGHAICSCPRTQPTGRRTWYPGRNCPVHDRA